MNGCVAEREGFEPPIRLPVCRISSAVLSTTQPPLRGRKTRKTAAARLCIQRARAKQGSLGQREAHARATAVSPRAVKQANASIPATSAGIPVSHRQTSAVDHRRRINGRHNKQAFKQQKK